MIMVFLKSIFYFTLSFIVLSIPLGDKKLFNHIDYFSHPYSKIVISNAKKYILRGKDVTIKFFTNSSQRKIDQVKSQLSSHVRRDEYDQTDHGNEDNSNSTNENYTHEEEQLLKKVLLDNL